MRVDVKPELIKWARERARIEPQDLPKSLSNVVKWENGQVKPTFKQLNRFAHAVHAPFRYLFLDKPPDERLPIADFRRESTDSFSRPSADLIDTLHRMQRRQHFMIAYLKDIGADTLDFVGSVSVKEDASLVGRAMRKKLGLDDSFLSEVRNRNEAVSKLLRRIRELGVLAVINGVVGNNTRRRLDVKEFRGFALNDLYAPLIFVNGADAKSAQMFTLVHELAHIWIGKGGLSGSGYIDPDEHIKVEEEWCNMAAAECLLPAERMEEQWLLVAPKNDKFASISRKFKVSELVVARRALDLKLIDRKRFFEFYQQHTIQSNRSLKQNRGGNFYNTLEQRLGEEFARCVLSAAFEGKIGFREAYRLTDLKGSSFKNYGRNLGFPIR